jgi:hypothetical protein
LVEQSFDPNGVSLSAAAAFAAKKSPDLFLIAPNADRYGVFVVRFPPMPAFQKASHRDISQLLLGCGKLPPRLAFVFWTNLPTFNKQEMVLLAN